ncbi:MAG: hypothetical protein ABSE16_19435 [Verrucomicrobiota bacterium]|jgi:hypothetical protein
MGRTFRFECPQCQYWAHISGGADTGMHCAVQTIICLDCHRLYDVLTRMHVRVRGAKDEPAARPARTGLLRDVPIPPLYLMENSWNNFTPGQRPTAVARPWSWISLKPVCPVARFHRIDPWREPGRCPRCGTFMEKNVFPYRLWE